MIIGKRILKVRLNGRLSDVPVTIEAPRQEDDGWACRLEIGWPGNPSPYEGRQGVDSMDALVRTLQAAGLMLHLSEEHASGNLMWQRPGGGYGFPPAPEIREMLQGDDRLTF